METCPFDRIPVTCQSLVNNKLKFQILTRENENMKMKLSALAVAAALVLPQAASADAVSDFYDGKTVKIVAICVRRPIAEACGGRVCRSRVQPRLVGHTQSLCCREESLFLRPKGHTEAESSRDQHGHTRRP